MVPARNAIVTMAHCHPVAQSHPKSKINVIEELRVVGAYSTGDIAKISLATWGGKFRNPVILSSRRRGPDRKDIS